MKLFQFFKYIFKSKKRALGKSLLERHLDFEVLRTTIALSLSISFDEKAFNCSTCSLLLFLSYSRVVFMFFQEINARLSTAAV